MIEAKLANFVIGTDYEQLPGEAVFMAKLCILDFLGVALAGVDSSTAQIMTRLVRGNGGSPLASVIGAGIRTSVTEAALANGTIGHALDYDEYSETYLGRPTASLVPASLALAEREELAGKDVLAAYILGWEVGAKVAGAVRHRILECGWHSVGIMNPIAAVAAAGKLLKLDSGQLQTAFGLASADSGGTRLNMGRDSKPYLAGRSARSGVQAALLAKDGFSAHETALTGQWGFCDLYTAGSECEEQKMVEGLGDPYDIVFPGASLKFYPSCGATHRALDAIFRLRKEHGIAVDDVVSIECFTTIGTIGDLIHHCPQTALEAKWSMEYCMAAALLDGKLGLSDLTDAMVQRPEAQAFFEKVTLTTIEGAPNTSAAVFEYPDTLVVKLKDGRELSEEVQLPPGHGRNTRKVTWDDMAVKFRDCAGAQLSDDRIERVLELCAELENLAVADIQELMTIVRMS